MKVSKMLFFLFLSQKERNKEKCSCKHLFRLQVSDLRLCLKKPPFFEKNGVKLCFFE